jgi:hypothetical protein
MNKIIAIAILVLTVISCNKTNKDISDDSNVNNEIIDISTTDDIIETNHKTYINGQFYKIILYDDYVLCKENSLDKNNSGIDLETDYDIILVNEKLNMNKKIITDNFYKILLLPNIFDQDFIEYKRNEDTIKVLSSAGYILQILDDNNYKLIDICIDLFENNVVQKEYIYKNSVYHDIVSILSTPNYFIVMHWDNGGREYTLINQQTGQYEILDTVKYEGH